MTDSIRRARARAFCNQAGKETEYSSHNIRLAPTGAQMRLALVCSVTTRLPAQEDALYDLRLITRDGSAYTALSRAGVEPQRMANIINARGLLARIVSPSLMEVADRRVSHLMQTDIRNVFTP
jgi:hypothetical protein